MSVTGPLQTTNKLTVHVAVNELTVSISQDETSPPVTTFQLAGIRRYNDTADPTVLLFVPDSGEPTQLRGSDIKTAEWWYEQVYYILENAGKAPRRFAGLPPVDPRTQLRYIEVPQPYMAKFGNLSRAVLYFFGPVKKYGVPSRLTKKFPIEERICFVSDVCLYVTKPNSEVTRCMRTDCIRKLYTNVFNKADPKDESFVVIKMKPPEYDLYLSTPACETLVEVICAMSSYANKRQQLPVENVRSVSDPVVDAQLVRPSGFEFSMVIPTSQTRLKTGLDNFSEKHGISFEYGPPQGPAPAGATTQAGGRSGGIASSKPAQQQQAGGEQQQGGTSSSSSSGGGGAAQTVDPLGVFLGLLNMERYYIPLYKKKIDLDVIECMETEDLANFGCNQADAEIIMAQIQDTTFMEKVKVETEEARKRGGWKKPEGSSSSGGIAGGEAAAPAQQQPEQQQQQQQQKAAIILDDDDFDLDLDVPADKKQTDFAIDLDDDLDLDLDVAPAAKRPEINLDDDDDI